jgi:hypothetical protein
VGFVRNIVHIARQEMKIIEVTRLPEICLYRNTKNRMQVSSTVIGE